jgi:hypothetical protein
MPYSPFLITISTNIKPSTQEIALQRKEAFRGYLKAVFGSADSLAQVVKFTPEGHVFSDETINEVDAKWSIEVGEETVKGGRLHAHIQLNIDHNSRIQINREKLYQLWEQILGWTKPWVSIQVSQNELKTHYISKQA